MEKINSQSKKSLNVIAICLLIYGGLFSGYISANETLSSTGNVASVGSNDSNKEISDLQRSIIVELKEIMAECKKQKKGINESFLQQRKIIKTEEVQLDNKIDRATALLDKHEKQILTKAEKLMDKYEKLLQLEEKIQKRYQAAYEISGGVRRVGTYGGSNRSMCVISTF